MRTRMLFPFPAVLGQEKMKRALILNYVNPRIGGVLISGEKGTAKSTLIRASSQIGGRKIVELPLNTTEDRLVGAVDFQHAIVRGERKLSPGILAQAHEQVLYVDEINLLSDNLVKTLVEAASDGFCRVEREGISGTYPCEFILIGSMNPEESGLRPQLLDRFGLYVEAEGEKSPLLRCEIIRRRLEFEAHPIEFTQKYQEELEKLQNKIQEARKRLPKVSVSDAALRLAGELCEKANCQGSRGEISIIETARAISALSGISAVNKDSILEAAEYALPHRAQEIPPPTTPPAPESDSPEQPQDQQSEENSAQEHENNNSPVPQEQTDSPSQEEAEPRENKDTPENQELPESWEACGDPFSVGKWLSQECRHLTLRKGSGRRSLVKTDSLQGRYVKSSLAGKNPGDIAFDATLRAAAPCQKNRDKNGMALSIKKEDLRLKVREKRTGNLIVFAVDASGSMGAQKRMAAVKGAILSLLNDAYQKRDQVALVTFRKNQADLALGITRSVDLAAKKLQDLKTGGKTPLYAGIETAHNLVLAARKKQKDLLPVVVLITDGRATCGKSKKPFLDAVEAGKNLTADHIKTIVIDAEQDFIKLKLAEKLADEIDAEFFTIGELHAGSIVTAVRMAQNFSLPKGY